MKFILLSTNILFIFVRMQRGMEVPEDCGDGQLVFASILYRHGERTPEQPYKNDPYSNSSFWPIGWGMLTNRGKMQHYILGRWLRKRYISLIPDGKYSQEVVYVRSTDYDRTLMSAESNLAGMFYPTKEELWGPLQWQPIPVHTTPRELDKVLGNDRPCPRYNEELANLINLPEVQAFYKEHQHLFDYTTRHTGEPMNDPFKIQSLYSTLYIQTLNNYTLPDWTRNIFPEKMYEVGSYGFSMNTLTKTQKRLFGGPLLKEMILHMKRKRAGILIPDRSLWVYSAHDVTVAATLDTMGVFDPHMPPFMATVLVELRVCCGEYFVQVYYKNTTAEPRLLTIPGCKPSCPLDSFEALLADVTPEDWDAECKTSLKSTTICK